MKYMLDTNICIYTIKKKPESVFKKLESISQQEIVISSITLSELFHGVNKSQRLDKNQKALLEFISPFQVVSYDKKAAEEYGKIRAFLEKQGTPIGSMDYLIAAHAISLNCVLVTNNVKEFKRIQGLKIESWI
ncbi:MAG: type II toxin-antitoxin system VapC family toxin [Leptospiraceae bacterium]|nr:type II toxin-antitoxin system VapC family toxin [Leptospiraceae bacterium]